MQWEIATKDLALGSQLSMANVHQHWRDLRAGARDQRADGKGNAECGALHTWIYVLAGLAVELR